VPKKCGSRSIVATQLEPGIVEPRHHLLEFAQMSARPLSSSRLSLMNVRLGSNSTEVTRRDSIYSRTLPEIPLWGAALFLQQLPTKLGVAAQVNFVDNRMLPWDGSTLRLAFPVEIRMDDDVFRREWRAVALVEGGVVADSS
jgi:hypothetical protein